MFDLNNFIVTNIVNGVKNGTFTKEYANIMAVNYMVKNVITQDDVEKISTEIESWEAEQNAVPVEPTEEEIPVEDVLTEETEPTEEDGLENDLDYLTEDETDVEEESENLLDEDGEPLS